MDTSGTYIKMCNCPKIQKQAQYKVYNYFVSIQTLQLRCSHLADYDYMKNMNMLHEEAEYIWLPRQDQIQEMLCPKAGVAYFTSNLFEWLEKPRQYQPKSMEQLWLCLYMHENHNLKWDGEKWIKTKES